MARIMIMAIALAAGGWGGYWMIGSGAQQQSIERWLQNRAQNGWVANYSAVEVRGFPNRFDSTVTDLELADPEYGWSWSAPQFQMLQLSYRPNHVIAVWPDRQVVATPEARVDVASDDMRASIIFEPDTDLALNRATLTLGNVRLNRRDGWTSGIDDRRILPLERATCPPVSCRRSSTSCISKPPPPLTGPGTGARSRPKNRSGPGWTSTGSMRNGASLD